MSRLFRNDASDIQYLYDESGVGGKISYCNTQF